MITRMQVLEVRVMKHVKRESVDNACEQSERELVMRASKVKANW